MSDLPDFMENIKDSVFLFQAIMVYSNLKRKLQNISVIILKMKALKLI